MLAKSCGQCHAELDKAMRCGHCKSVWYCDRACQRQHWSSHKSECKILALALLTSSSSVAAAAFTEAATVQTRGAAGWDHFVIDGADYLAVANFFSSSPGRQPSMKTESTIYRAAADGMKLRLTEVQGFLTTGAHGVVHFEHDNRHYLAVPNYYGGDAVVLRWEAGRFTELQRLKCDGGGGVEAFRIGDQQMLALAEFNLGVAAVFRLSGTYPNERFKSFQRVAAPGCGSIAMLSVPAEGGGEQLLMLAASYVTRQVRSRAAR